MLKKEFRLTKFSLEKPQQVITPQFNLKFSKNDSTVNHFAFVVSKKVDSRATSRNRMKRKVRAAVEQIFDKIETGYDFIFYPKKVSENEEVSSIVKSLESVLSKQNLLVK